MMAVPRSRATQLEARIKAALWFAARGFGIFPVWSADAAGRCRCPKGAACENAGKHPVTARGFLDATTDPVRIRTFLSAGSQPNYGLVNPEGVFTLDVDGDGTARLAEFEERLGPLPATLTTDTANGKHVFLRWPDELPRPIGQLWGFVTRWGSGRDAGYVIGPRSIHPSGKEYTPSGTTFEIATVPPTWADDAIGSTTTADTITIGAGPYELPEWVAAGGRYEAIRSYTAHLYNTSRLAPEQMWLLVRDELAPRFVVPLTTEELRARFDRVVEKMPERLGERRGLPPEPIDPSTFPLPENRGEAVPSELAAEHYIEDLVRPGRLVVWAAEEGSGKSYAVAGELAIRVAATGGTFAGTWPVVQTGPVLVLSEMHPDDDYDREGVVLASLGRDRSALAGRYWRLSLMTAAGGRPALTVPEWRSWVVDWMRANGVILLVVDTATGATQVDPWGRAIQAVFADLRAMTTAYPELAVVLIVHVRKPSRPGDRALSDVLGEWGRWCDVVVVQENDGKSLTRAKLTSRKRVARERRILATKQGGLLIDAVDLAAEPTTKVAPARVLEVIAEHPEGLGYAELGAILDVSNDTAGRYVKALGDAVDTFRVGPKREIRVILAPEATAAPPHTSARTGAAVLAAVPEADEGADRRTAARTCIGAAVPRAAVIRPAREPEWVHPCLDYDAHRDHHHLTPAGWSCRACHPEEIA